MAKDVSKTAPGLSRLDMAVYAGPAAGLAALGLPLSMYIPNFYVSNVGISAGAAALVFMLIRFWDVATDPLLGFLSDRFNMPFGRRKFWVGASAPILMISTYLVFIPPEGVGVAYLATALFILYIGWTMIQISHLAWAAELTSSYDERSRLMGYRELLLLAGMFIVLSIAAYRELSAPAELVQIVREQSINGMGVFIILLIPVTVILAMWRLPDKAPAKRGPPDQIVKGLVAIMKSDPLRRIVISDLLYRGGAAVTGTTFLWYMSARLDLARFASLSLTLYFLAALIAVPFWIRLAERLDKHTAFIASVVSPGVMLLPFLWLDAANPSIPGVFAFDLSGIGLRLADELNGDQVVGLLLMIVYGVTYGGAPMFARAIMSDVIDHDRLGSRNHRSGLFFSLLTLTEKVGTALAVGLALFLIGLIGFDPAPGAENSPEVIFRLALVYVGPSSLLYIGAAVLMLGFPITREKHAEIQAELAARD